MKNTEKYILSFVNNHECHSLVTSKKPRRAGLVASVSTSHTVGRGSRPGRVIPKTIIKMVQTALHCTHALGKVKLRCQLLRYIRFTFNIAY